MLWIHEVNILNKNRSAWLVNMNPLVVKLEKICKYRTDN